MISQAYYNNTLTRIFYAHNAKLSILCEINFNNTASVEIMKVLQKDYYYAIFCNPSIIKKNEKDTICVSYH